jgi:hypothetical protein
MHRFSIGVAEIFFFALLVSFFLGNSGVRGDFSSTY